uniref:Uncharacterized protein n=1 Tax=Tanacetum cinerariifolium TaxID=118510 RepID=A0A699IB86_TANCI|nr:hypothetical protein [Tanacetum cinerariifolium]
MAMDSMIILKETLQTVYAGWLPRSWMKARYQKLLIRLQLRLLENHKNTFMSRYQGSKKSSGWDMEALRIDFTMEKIIIDLICHGALLPPFDQSLWTIN